MTRQLFMDRLRSGLRGLPPGAIDEIVADYEAHFAEAAAAGRGETEVAAALGDPKRLARELRTEAGLKRWEAERTASAAAGAAFAVAGLGAVDLVIAIPVVTSLGSTLLAFFLAALAFFVIGALLFAVGPFVIQGGVAAAEMLAGLGLMASAVTVAALCALLAIGLVNALVWYGRLHLRLLRPVLDSKEIVI